MNNSLSPKLADKQAIEDELIASMEVRLSALVPILSPIQKLLITILKTFFLRS